MTVRFFCRNLVLIGSISFVIGAFADLASVTPSEWRGGATSAQMKRHLEKLALIRSTGGAPVVFVGDSITHFWEWNGHGKRVWANCFEKGSRRALNLGTGGDRTEHVLWRLEHGELDGYEAKCVILLIGTNNNAQPFAKTPPMDTIFGVRRVLDVIAAKQPKARIILMALFPCDFQDIDEHRRRNFTVNRELQKFADGRRVIWCDLSSRFLTPDGKLSYDYFTDLLHPSELGYEVWASGVVPLVDRVLVAGPDEFVPSVFSEYPRHAKAERWETELARSRFAEIDGKWSTRVLEIRNAIVSGATNEYETVWIGDGTGVPPTGEGVLDLSVAGDHVEHVLWRLENGHLEGFTAKRFIVHVGNRNTGSGGQFIALGIRRVLDLIGRKQPKATILLDPLVATGTKPEPRVVGIFDMCNQIIRKYADGKRIVWNEVKR